MKIKHGKLKLLGRWISQVATVTLVCVGCGGGGYGGAPIATAPTISTQPASQSVAVGIAANFSVVAYGSAPLSYQWKRDGVDVAGATLASYSLATAQVVDTKSKWSVVVRNTAGSVTSAEAILTVPGIGLLAGSIQESGIIDGVGVAARFGCPNVAVDGTGNVYVADVCTHIIRKLTSAGVVTTLAGSPASSTGSGDGIGAAAGFNYPQGVAGDGAGNVYVADTRNYTIRKITSAGVVTTLAGTAGVQGTADGTAAAARFTYPIGVAVDAAGNVYVLDTGNYTIRKITSAGVVTTLASGFISVVGPSFLTNMQGITVDGAGNVYVSDLGMGIVKITSAGVVTTLPGTAGVYLGGGMAIDGTGNIYVADTRNYTILKITPAGVVTTVAGTTGSSAIALGNLPGSLFEPRSLAIDANGVLYVASGHAILKIQL